MKIFSVKADLLKQKADLLAFFFFENEKKLSPAAQKIDQKLKGALAALFKKKEFTGKEGSFCLISTLGCLPAQKVALIGLGEKKDFSADKLRLAGATLIKAAKLAQAEKIVLEGDLLQKINEEELACCLAEGIILGNYEFSGYKTKKDEPKKEIQEVVFVTEKEAMAALFKKGIHLGEIIGRATNTARDLVNAAPNQMTPTHFVNFSRKILKSSGVKLKVLEKSALKKLGLGAFLAVAQGSAEPPKMLVLQYSRGARKNKKIGLVGKGITFDSGGISLKPSKNMFEMKTDMAGAAAVLLATKALADLKLKINLLTVIPLTENMPSGSASKPADVVTAANKKTIEIISTDAEGRLLLADALDYAGSSGAKFLIDVATLTGGCVTALGDLYSGVFSNNEKFLNQVIEAGKQAGERLWPFPFDKKYSEYLKSDLADLKNCTDEGKASPIVGGIFLSEFVRDIPWVHLDIAGTAYLSREIDYLGKNATGVGVRTLVYLFLENNF